MGALILENVKSKLKHPGTEIKNHLKFGYGVDVEYNKARRSVQAAKNNMYGTYQVSFDRLKKYSRATIRYNPGSRAFVERDQKTKRFKRSFFAWNACLEGFKSCRPMVSVDGTHMPWKWRGVILSATGKYANNGLFLISLVLVTAENLDNWIWFLEQLRDILKHDKRYSFYQTATRPQGHRESMCVLLTECAYAPTKAAYEESVIKFKTAGGALAVKFLENLDPKYWAYAFEPNIVRYGEMTSNASESFNNWIEIARGLPVTQMVETIRADVMRWFVERKKDAEKWTSLLCTRRQDVWNFNVEASRTWVVADCMDGTIAVGSNPSVTADIKTRTCTCYQWQIQGFPCAHAVAAILKTESSIYDVVDQCFFADTYKKAYSHHLHNVPGTASFESTSDLEDELILPPLTQNNPCRPPNKRKRSYMEVPKKKLSICPICNKKSRHDRLTCLEKHQSIPAATSATTTE